MSQEDRVERSHPSYGMVQFNRVQGNPGRMFGSSLDNHSTFFTFRLSECVQICEDNQDRYFGGSKILAEVSLTSAQFCELITGLNVGCGVPCTIQFVNGAHVQREEPPDTEVQRIKDGYSEALKGMVDRMQKYRREIDVMVAKMPAKVRDQIRINLDVMEQGLTSSIPFHLEMFNEASDRVVSAAKAEIEAFATHAVVTAGLAALHGEVEKREQAALSPGEGETR